MADTNIVTAPASAAENGHQRVIWLSPLIGYYFYTTDTTKIPTYKKTTTGPEGFAAATPVAIGTAQGGSGAGYGIVATWEKENGYALNNVIHIFWMVFTTKNIKHKSLDCDTDTLSAEHNVITTANNMGGQTSMTATCTSNGDCLVCFKLNNTDANADATYRSQNGGATWAAVGGDLPAAPLTYPDQTVLPWIHWDGSDEDIVLIQQELDEDTLRYFVLDMSTGTWSSVQTVGYDGTFRRTTSTGHCSDAVYQQSDGTIWFSGNWLIATAPVSMGIRFFKLTSTGQGNVGFTELAEILPSVGEDQSYYSGLSQNFLDNKAGKIYSFYFHNVAEDHASAYNVVYKVYTIGVDAWVGPTQYDESGGIDATRYVEFIMLPKGISLSAGGWLSPIFFMNPIPSGQEYWRQNLVNQIEIPAGGGGGGGGEDTPGVPILDPTYVQGVVTIT